MPKNLEILTPVNPETGLMNDQVVTSEKNVIEQSMTKSYRSIFLENTFTLFNIINFVLAGMVIYTGSYRNMLFMGVVLFNIAVGLFQEIRSKKILDHLALISQDKASVLRSGRVFNIPIDEVVKNDILILSSGSQVCADCVVLEGYIEVNESMITGESVPVARKKGDPVYSGTYVVSGQAKVQAVQVGVHTYAYSILKEAKRQKPFPSQLRDSMNAIIRFSTVVLIPTGILLLIRAWFATYNLNESILSVVAALVGMIPEGLVVLTSIALAAASTRLAAAKVLVQELYCIETLARVDTLCLDKTGTITKGEMSVSGIKTFGTLDEKQAEKILGRLYHALPDTNATAEAIRKFAPFYDDVPAREVFPFSSARKYSAASFDSQTYYCGAYEFIFDQPDESISQLISQYTQKGLRVLALAQKQKKDEQPKLLALIFVEDVLRPDAKEILDYFYKQDVDIKIISGDDPKTVAAIAQRAGVIGSAVDMQNIEPGETMDEALKANAVFGRVSPEQKKEMILALERMGRTVAMTGDGVNDVMALKEADCSIAMGSGSQAARAVASLVLLEDQFDALPRILNQGRCVINNIQRTASLFLVKTMFSFGLSILTLFWLGRYPFQPIQLTLVSSLCTGIPSFILTLEPNNARVKGNFLLNVFSKALPGALNVILAIAVVNISSYFIYMDENVKSTICTILAGINALAVLRSVSVPLSPLRKLLLICMTCVFILCIVFLPQYFLLVRPDWGQLAFIAVCGIGLLFTLQFLSRCSWERFLLASRILPGSRAGKED